MIGIRTYDTAAIRRLFSQAGISESRVIFNPPNEADCSVILTIGGWNVHNAHCFVQSAAGKPWIQCLDPKETFIKPTNLAFILCALQKASQIDEHGAPPSISEEILLGRTEAEILDFLGSCKSASLLSVDIETRQDVQEITCIGFAYQLPTGPYVAMSVPFERSGHSIWSPESEARIWRAISQTMDSPNAKLFQNFIFDTMYLSRFGIQTNGAIYDTMVLSHLLNPELPKGLHDIARMYLMCEPWKNLTSFESTEELWHYNALDCLRTLQAYSSMYEALSSDTPKRALWDSQLVPLATEVLRMCERGWTVDKTALSALSKKITAELDPLVASLKAFANPLLPDTIEMVHRKLHIRSGAQYFLGKGSKLTTKKLAYTSYEPFPITGLKSLKGAPGDVFERVVTPRDFNPLSQNDVKDILVALEYKIPTYKGAETTDERALSRLNARKSHKFITDVLRVRELSKLLNTYVRVKLDEDEKLRFSINMAGTVEGRFSSQQTPWDTGLNIQNLPKSFRCICVPSSPDMVILNLDFKAADPHIVAWISGEKEIARTLAAGGDLHALTASKMLGRDITCDPSYNKDASEERQFGKCCNNGLNYGMGVDKFQQEVCFKTGINISREKASDLYDRYHAAYPGIKAWHDEVRTALLTTRRLRTPFGRERFFHGNLRDTYVLDKVWKSALAWIAPTTVADALNCGWLRFVSLANEGSLRYNILQQCHDSLMLEVSTYDLERVAELLKKAFSSVRFKIKGIERVLPVELSTGPNGRDLQKLK